MIAVMMTAALTASAQMEEGTFSFMPKVGYNHADISGGKDFVDNKGGVAAGFELEYKVASWFGISAGAMYEQEGWKYKEGSEKQENEYINVPVMANVYVAPGFAVKLGVQPGFKVNAEASAKQGSNAISADNSSQFNSVDFSIPVGVSYEFSNVVLDARYNWGLTKTFKDLDNKNTVFQFTVGYKFAL